MSVNVYNKTNDTLIPIADAPEKVLNDNTSSSSKTYSSEKIENMISDVTSSNFSKRLRITSPIDILEYAESSCPMNGRTLIRVHAANATNNPFGVTTDTDFFYDIDKIDSLNSWIAIYAKDVRTNTMYVNTKNNVTWAGWKQISFVS